MKITEIIVIVKIIDNEIETKMDAIHADFLMFQKKNKNKFIHRAIVPRKMSRIFFNSAIEIKTLSILDSKSCSVGF